MCTKLMLFLSLAAFHTMAQETSRDLYSNVGECSDNMLANRITDFDIHEIANTGYYTYLFSNGLEDGACASAEIHGDDNIGFAGTITQLKNRQSVTTSYSLDKYEKGIIQETLTVEEYDEKTEYYYKLIVLGWNRVKGIFYFGRCADLGTSKYDIRSIVIKECNAFNFWARESVYKYANIDYLSGYKGELKEFQGVQYNLTNLSS